MPRQSPNHNHSTPRRVNSVAVRIMDDLATANCPCGLLSSHFVPSHNENLFVCWLQNFSYYLQTTATTHLAGCEIAASFPTEFYISMSNQSRLGHSCATLTTVWRMMDLSRTLLVSVRCLRGWVWVRIIGGLVVPVRVIERTKWLLRGRYDIVCQGPVS